MTRNTRIKLAAGLLGLVGIAAAFQVGFSEESSDKKVQPSPAQEARPKAEQAVFMRGKLDASNQILEGLVTEDSKLIAKGAKILVEMSAAEKWQVRHDPMYKQHSGDFQQSAKKLLESAEQENFDAVALKWIDTTLKCIECHKFVRGTRIANGN